MGDGQIAINLERTFDATRFCPGVPIEHARRFAEITIGLGILVIERDRFGRGFLNERVCFERRHVSIRQPQPDFRNPTPGGRECWILVERALKESEGFTQVFLAALVCVIQAP